jgi:hypothetical protein|tara:strand:+ start:337 stop:1386 length:1050 start_codon:yes stop_codon:yes gene_type:complete
MTLIQTLSNTLPCPYFDNPDNKVNLKDPDNWTFPITDLGIDGVEILHKQYGLFKDTNDDNIGRAEGTDPAQVLVIKEDVEENGVDHTQPPVFVDVDTGDLVTGDHRKQTKIQGWMFQYVRCRDAWARKRLAKALNNGRQYHQKNNSKEDIKEHIKYGIANGHLTTEQEIEDEINMLSNNSLRKNDRANIMSEMISFIHQTGATVSLNRYRTFTDDSYNTFVENSSSDYKKEVIDDAESNTYYYGSSGTSIANVLTPASKIDPDSEKPYLNVVASVTTPSNKHPLIKKRKDIHEYHLKQLSSKIDKLGIYKFRHGCYPWEHPDCRHAFPAQDHMQEDVNGGEFIEYNDIK